MDVITHIVYWCLILALSAAVIMDGFTIARLRQEKRENNHNYRRRNAEICSVRLDELEQDQNRHRACEIEAGELRARLKAANLIADGWRMAAEKGRGVK